MSERTSRTRPAARAIRLALVAVVGLTCLFAVGQHAGATPKAAAATASVRGLERVPAGPVSGTAPTKSLQPRCSNEPGRPKHVIGGGGVVNDNGAHKVMLVGMQPFQATPDGYTVVAKAPPGFTGSWTLTAYVVCADAGPLSGWEIKFSPPKDVPASSEIQSATTQVSCSSSAKKVIGTGAYVSQGTPNTAEVGLQVFRSDADRNAAKVFAREDANGYPNTWSTAAFAICTDPVPGTAISGVLREGREADVLCFYDNGPLYVAGAAGGSGPSAVFLQTVLPSDVGRRRLDVATTGADPLGIIAQAICVPQNT